MQPVALLDIQVDCVTFYKYSCVLGEMQTLCSCDYKLFWVLSRTKYKNIPGEKHPRTTTDRVVAKLLHVDSPLKRFCQERTPNMAVLRKQKGQMAIAGELGAN